MSALGILSRAWTDFTGRWPALLATGVVYKLVAFILLTPLVGLALRGFMAVAGRSILADQDLFFFALNPIGIVTLIVVAAAIIAIVATEQAALMMIGFGAMRGVRVGVRDSLGVAFRHLGSILAITVRLVGRVLLLAAPFLAASGLVYGLLLTEHDINFYLSNRPPAFYVAAALIAAIVSAFVGLLGPRLIGWTYALPLHLFEEIPANRALLESTERTKGHRPTVAAVLIGWASFSILLSSVAIVAVTALGRLIVPRTGSAVAPLLVVIGALLLLWYALNLLVTLIQASSLALLVVRLYDRHGSSEAARLPAEVAQMLTSGVPRWSLGFKTLLWGLLAGTILAGATGYYLLRSVRTDDDVMVIAHRGAAGRSPENTMASFEAAIADGADLVELDVQETRDGVVVVIHDSDFMKVAGERVKVWQGDFEELRAFDIGSWYSPTFSAERLPTLEEVLDLAKSRGARLDIELKYYGHNQRLEQRVINLVEAEGMTFNVVIMSLKKDMVQKVRELRPGWTVGLLTATAVGNLAGADADFLAVHVAMATASFVRRAHSAGKDVYVWTVNDPVNMSRMMSRGVDGVITDEPVLAKTVIAERTELGSIERLLLEVSDWLGTNVQEPPPETDVD